ncbi:MAG TPA: flagellar hook-length control protein FliK [Holophagaceae bacterium]|nr:flagellar hook-length control protein FliK [Holophagaceae bacterium]
MARTSRSAGEGPEAPSRTDVAQRPEGPRPPVQGPDRPNPKSDLNPSQEAAAPPPAQGPGTAGPAPDAKPGTPAQPAAQVPEALPEPLTPAVAALPVQDLQAPAPVNPPAETAGTPPLPVEAQAALQGAGTPTPVPASAPQLPKSMAEAPMATAPTQGLLPPAPRTTGATGANIPLSAQAAGPRAQPEPEPGPEALSAPTPEAFKLQVTTPMDTAPTAPQATASAAPVAPLPPPAEAAAPASPTVAALPEDPGPKSPTLRATPATSTLPGTAAPLVAPPTESPASGSDANGPGAGPQGQPKLEALRRPGPEAQVPASETPAAPAKSQVPEGPAVRVDAARPEAPKVEGAKPQPTPGPVREMTMTLPATAPVATAGTEFKAPASPVVNQVETTLRWMVKGPVPEAKLQLHPENLGKVSIELKVSEGQVHAKVWVQEPAAMQALQDGRANLEQALKQSGLQLGSFDLQQGGDASRHAPEPQTRQASAPKGEPAPMVARQEAPAPASARAANPRRIELYV